MDDLSFGQAIGIYILCMIICAAIILLFVFGLTWLTKGRYEYTDLNGNKGIATRCMNTYGNLVCCSNGKSIKVAEYERVGK